MKCYIVDTLAGIFAVDEVGNILNFILLNENGIKMINFYSSLDKGNLLEDYLHFIKELSSSGFDEFVFDKRDLEGLSFKKLGYHTSIDPEAAEFSEFRNNLVQKLKSIGINKTQDELKLIFKGVSEQLIKSKVSESGAQNDIIIIQIIETLDIIKKSI